MKRNHNKIKKMAAFAKQIGRTLFSLSKILLRKLGFASSGPKIISNSHQTQLPKHASLIPKSSKDDKSKQIMVFDMEDALLTSPSLFPYLMLVAFEAGGLIRALILLLLYPFVCLLGEEVALNIMVFISFFGIKKDRFRAGSAVLPKFFLEDVGCEGFDLIMSFEKKIGVSKLPRIMVEGFLKDYIGVECVVGRELKVVYGYFVGLMEEKAKGFDSLNFVLNEKKFGSNYAIGIGCSSNRSLLWKLPESCKEVYTVTESEKRNWRILPRKRYPIPLIFHDSRLGFRPTPFATMAMFMWLPFGLFLCFIRMIVGILLPYNISCMVHAFTGALIIISEPKQPVSSTNNNKPKSTGRLYVCNHRTLLDPIYISCALMKPVSAVTYSMSRFNEAISPIRTVRLTRDKERDRKQMNKMLSQGDVVVCPEGTTCREPYLLRFSPLFAEITEEIIPVAIDVDISMFYGSTAAGFKCLDPIFHYLNPRPVYLVKFLDKLPGSHTHMSNIDVANYVQAEIAKTLGFQSTNLTRKHKYIILAGNEGIV